jgi:transposase
MGSRVETFEQIRRGRGREGISTRALAARYGVHRRAVRQALEAPLPRVKRRPVGRPAPKLGPYRGLIDSWLDGDRDAPRKQRHTAKRIWERLRDEHAADVAERMVREYVHGRRRERGEGVQAFVPQVHVAGVEAEVDWGEAHVAMAGGS